MTEQFLKPWKVTAIQVLPNKRGVEVTLCTEGRDPISFQTKRFAIGRRGAKSAALAKFASAAGYGDAEDLYLHVTSLPANWIGDVFFGSEVPNAFQPEPAPALRCVFPAEDAA